MATSNMPLARTPASVEEADLLCSISSSASTPPTDNKTKATMEPPAPASASSSSRGAAPPSSCPPSHHQQSYVDHTYVDYSTVVDDDLRCLKAAAAGAVPGHADREQALMMGMNSSYGMMMKGRNGGGSSAAMPFPGKLLEVLDRGDLTSIIDWMPHGRAFIVKQPKVFTTQVLPRFFKQTKFLSFTRQLNLWGFKRITRGLDAGAYYHALFLPGRPNLAMRMKRQKIKGTGIRPIPNPEQEPNFYYKYPHVARVPRSRVPIPLPPLPSERIANLLNHGVVDPQVQTFVGQGGLTSHQTSLPQQTNFEQNIMTHNQGNGLGNLGGLSANSHGLGLDNMSNHGVNVNNQAGLLPSKSTMSAAAAAEQRLLGSMNSGLHSSSMAGSLRGASSGLNNLPESLAPAPGGRDLASSVYRRRASMASMSAPRDFRPTIGVEDEVSSANRRLMERLLEQTSSAPAPHARDLLHGRRNSFQRSLLSSNNVGLLRQESVGSLASTPAPGVSRDSFKLGAYNLPPPSRTPSLSTNQLTSLHSGLSPATSIPSRTSTQDINVATVTNALREAQHLEELARSQRATARAMAGALQQRMGGQDVTLPLDFNPFDEKR